MENTTNYIQLEVLTPLCVGAGNDAEWNPGSDYVKKDGMVYILDIKKAAENCVDIEKLSYLLASPDEEKIIAVYGNALEASSNFIFDMPASSIYPIKSFMRTGLHGNPLIAGSSLKGAIRSSLFKHFRLNHQHTNVDVFGDMQSGTDFMRFIKIRDIEMRDTLLVNTKIFNLHLNDGSWEGGWKNKDKTVESFDSTNFNTLYECVIPGQKGVGEILMSGHQFEIAPTSYYDRKRKEDIQITAIEKKKEVFSNSCTNLFSIINSNTRDYLKKELKFFSTYQVEKTEEIVENIKELLQMIPKDNSYCVLKMSAGVGFHSITGDWQYEDYTDTGFWPAKKDDDESEDQDGKKKYKSRKIADYNGSLKLMGFVKLSVIERQQYNEALDLQKKQYADKLENDRKDAETRRKASLEAQKEREAEELLKQRLKKYEELVYEAIRIEDSNPALALEKVKEAVSLLPNKTNQTLHINILNRLEKWQIDNNNKKEEKNYNVPLADALEGIGTYMSDIVKEIKNWKKAGNTITDEELPVILGAVSNLSDKEKKKVRDLEKVIGKNFFKTLVHKK